MNLLFIKKPLTADYQGLIKKLMVLKKITAL